MALAKVPIVPQWNVTSGCICTPDGGFLYVGARSINYIGRIKDAGAPLLKTFHTRQSILGIDVDPSWSADQPGGERHFASLAQDNSVQIWDFDKGCAFRGHKAHFNASRFMEGNGPPPKGERVLFSYMRNRNVFSIDAQDMVIYCVASNTFCRRPSFLHMRSQQLTVLRCSPFNENIFALGDSRGLVVIGNLQSMSVIYTLRGHNTPITALAWRPTDGVACSKTVLSPSEPKTPKAKVVKAAPPLKPSYTAAPVIPTSDDIFDIYDYDYLENEFGVAASDAKQRKDSEGDFMSIGIENPQSSAADNNFDFAEACQSLRQEIDARKQDELAPAGDAVTLADCQQVERTGDISSSCGSNESTEGSMELIGRDSSDDDVDVDGTERKPKQQILHQAEVHAAQAVEPAPAMAEKIDPVPLEPTVNADKTLPKSADKQQSNEPHAFLASASMDGHFWIWNAETGACCDNVYSANANGKPGKNTNIEIIWLSSSEFITTNKQGDIAYWLQQPHQQQTRFKFKEEKHNFQQCAVISFGVARKDGLLWCISSHREISCENILTGEPVAKYCCASTNISVMRECPDDMNKIALGFTDRRIGIIDISKMTSTNVYIENFTLRIDSPVLSIVWSPDSKRLAYGTIEGRVGIVNVEHSKQQPFTFNSVCGKPVYSIDWQDNNVFVVCNDRLAIYNINMEQKDAHIVPNILSISSVSVRGDRIFVGTQGGRLEVYLKKSDGTPAYELVQTFDLAPRYITEIAWSPMASDQLAVVANANNIHILNYDCASGELTVVRKIVMKNAKAANACIKWSNRKRNEFLTCGFDGAVRVWDLDTEGNEEKFLKQFHCPMTCGLFLPTDENVVICAGKSTSVEFFDMRLEKSMDYSPAKWKRSNAHALDSVQWAVKVATRSEAKPLTAAQKRRLKRSAAGVEESALVVPNGGAPAIGGNKEIADMLNSLKIVEEKAPLQQQCEMAEMKEKLDKGSAVFMKNSPTLLYLTTKELNKDVLEKLKLMLIDAKQQRNNLLSAKLFGTKDDAKKLLAEELKNHKHSETKGISNIFMPQVNGTLKDEILHCVQNKQLTEWHVSLAPTISYNFWQKCCRAYAEQLLEKGYALQAATYMLALHNAYDAIKMLLEKEYFKEALLLARIHLLPEDPLFNQIADKWIQFFDSKGNLPGAALLCILSGQMNRAHEILARVRSAQPEIEQLLQILKTNQK